MSELLADYYAKSNVTFEDIIAFHVAFERIHPFQNGNGRVGKLILFKECLRQACKNPLIVVLKFFVFSSSYFKGIISKLTLTFLFLFLQISF